MKNDPKTDMTNITVHLFAPMYAAFDQQMTDLHLQRDAFLDHIVANELIHLREDLVGKKLSPKANRYISQSLKSMGDDLLKKKSFKIRHSTAAALNQVVEDHNLVRNSFFNLLMALLRSSDQLLERLDLPTRVSRFRDDGTEDMPTSPLLGIREIQRDPLYYLRSACQHRHGTGLYDMELRPALHGFACYLTDEHVPGTPENARRLAEQEREAALLVDLDIFESNPPPVATKPV